MTTTATDPTTLIQWRGHPVPWVTRWTGERTDNDERRGALSVTMIGDQLWLRYKDGEEDREPNGILWQREGLTRSGEPEYSQINTYRQRRSMRRRICQVCGTKIQSKVIRWLLDPRQLNEAPDGESITMSPPTCDACVPLALDLCPHLRRSSPIIANVLEYRLWGVYGEGVAMTEDGLQRMKGLTVKYDWASRMPLTAVAAKQQMVEFVKFRLEA